MKLFPAWMRPVALATAFVTSALAQTVTLNPIADAHVLSGPGLENLNVGKLPVLEVNHSSSPLPWFERVIYLKFDLSNVTSVRTARLRLYGASHGPDIVTTDLLSSPDVSWTETGIKWNNKPAVGPVLWDTIALQESNAWHEWDISQYLMGEKAMGRDVVTLVLNNSVASGLGLNLFRSREHPFNKPQLVIEQAFPWTYYEAEKGTASAGATLDTGVLWGDIAFEARGKQTVTLNAAGESVEWTNVKAATHATVRYSIADAATGTLALYVNGVKRADLALTSVRMREAKPTGVVPNGNIVRFFDDVMVAVPGGIPAGATVRLQKDVDDPVDYVVDFLEVETSTPAGVKPDETWVSVQQGTASDRMAFVNAIATAAAGSKNVWVPAGTYVINPPVSGEPNRTGYGIEVPAGITIRGAGIWHTTIVKNYGGSNRRVFSFIGDGVTVQNFKFIDTITTLTDNGQNVLVRADTFGGHLVEGIWAEYGTLFLGFHTQNSIVRDNRMRNAYKDTIHFARNAVGNLVERNVVRNAGDDNVAFIAYENTGMANNIAQYNVAECGYWGRGLTNSGGDGNILRYNLANNCVRAGIFNQTETYSGQTSQFSTNWVIERNVIVRCGNQRTHGSSGALSFYAAVDCPVSGRIEHNLVLAPPFHGARLQGYIGDAGTDPVNFFRYNMIEDSVTGGAFVRKSVVLQPDTNLVHEPNTDL